MNVTAATLSEALKKLVETGYVAADRELDDERRRRLCLTENGLNALSQSSVLDTEKLGNLMACLSEDERQHVVDGMRLLAEAAERGVNKKAGP